MRGVSRGDADWAAIELAYCAGLEAVREIARRFKVSESAIRKRAAAERWVRDGATLKVPELDPAEIVRRGQDLANRMLDELEAQTAKQGQMRALILEASGDDQAARDAALKSVSLPRRAVTLKTLMQAAELATRARTGGAGKKAEKQAAADRIAGRFAAGAPPRMVVDNTRK